MDWVEQLLHVSPDKGDGTIELVIYIVLIAFLAPTVTLARMHLQKRRDRD